MSSIEVLAPAPSRPASSGRAGLRRRGGYWLGTSLHLVHRELKSRHRRSVLGWVWALVPPLMQLAVAEFLFTKVIPLGVANYPVFLLTGLLAWNWLAASLTMATWALEGNRALVLRPGFQIALLPFTSVLTAFADYLLALPVLLVAVALTEGLHASALLLPVLLLVQMMFSLGLAWLVAPLQVLFRDTRHLIGIVVMLGFWVTPVFYSRARVPHRFRLLYDANPMAHLVEWHRQILLDGAGVPAAGLGLLALAGAAVLAGGYAAFRALRDAIPDQL